MFYTNQKFLGISWMSLWVMIATLGVCFPLHAQTIKIGGSGNTLGTMKLLANTYTQNNPQIKIIVLPSIGSSGGIKAAAKGAIDIGLSSRALKESELNKGIISVEYARSPTIIGVSNQLDVTEITLEQLVDIYAGKLLHWPDGSLIRPILRQPGDDNTIQLKRLSPDMEKAIVIADERTGLLFASTDQEAVDKIENTPGSFGVTSLALVLSENRAIRALKIDGIEATPANANSALYPIVKRFYLILPNDLKPHVQDFINYIKSPAGAAVLQQNGNSAVQ